ncbi:MAG: HEAT repeat domain-containing protein [Verrucomicrobiota bacterium]
MRTQLLARVAVAVLLMLALMAALVALSLPGKREPSYQGRSLSQWLKTYTLAGQRQLPWEQRAPAMVAIRSLGPNHLPLLLQWVRFEPARGPGREVGVMEGVTYSGFLPAWQTKVPSVLKPLLSWWSQQRPLRDDEAALAAFHILGPAASAAIPELEHLALATNHPYASRTAVVALARIGKASLPSLLTILANTNAPNLDRVMECLGNYPDLATNAHAAVPMIVRHLKNPDAMGLAVTTLGKLALEPGIAVPALMDCLPSSNDWLRGQAIVALGRFGSEARSAVPALNAALQDADPSVRNDATNALRSIAPETLPNPPLAVERK